MTYESSAYTYEPGAGTTTETYAYSAYNANIDPDLMADLNRNK